MTKTTTVDAQSTNTNTPTKIDTQNTQVASKGIPTATPASTKQVPLNIPKWLIENKDKFVPPVCNYMMHGAGRLKVMFVGGPNIRKDFHLEEGEEFFYMVEGDMTLIVVEAGKFKDVVIKEGEVFQLPGKILHSPQRYEGTMGLVIERERMQTEMDCVRYFVGDSTEILHEEWFYCEDLGTQLGPVIKRYFASEAHRTQKPVPGTITTKAPFLADATRKLEEPFHLMTWVKKHDKEIQEKGRKNLWDVTYQSEVLALGAGTERDCQTRQEEIWLWQLVGSSVVEVEGAPARTLHPQDSLLITAGSKFSHSRALGSVALSVAMPWANKQRAFPPLELKNTTLE